jgi:hypothetical protein
VNTEEKSIIDQIYDQPNYQQWYIFRNDSFPDTDLKNLKFEKINFLQFKHLNPLSAERINEVKTRDFTLNYSPNQNYFLNIYLDIAFEKIPNVNNRRVLGRGVDPSFAYCSLKDSLCFVYTAGTTSFFEESIWISETVFVILGVSFWPAVDDSYQQFMLITGEIKDNTVDLTIYLSQQLFPWKSNWTEYMQYKHPNLIFNF